jgi:flavin-dependent dehydrogenase
VNGEREVCVVGGGPAGAALAARLARLGRDVVVVERHRFPRAHVGESLSPAIWPLLDTLGVGEQVATAGSTPAAEARVRWRADGEARVRVDNGASLERGLTVDRGIFDAILLQHARSAGATVLTGAAARRPVRRDEGWDVPLDGSVLRARFLADASGRRRLLGGRRKPTSPRTLALHAIWDDGPAPDDAQTRIEALADGWLWGAHLPGGGFRAMAFVDPQALVTAGDGGRLYRGLLAASSMFADLLSGARLIGRVQACDATSYAADAPIDTHSVKVGEAAFAIDPLSSSGVQTAIQTGVAAAAAVHSILAPDGDDGAAITFYDEHQRHSIERHAATAASIYAEQRSHADAEFWRRRAAGHVGHAGTPHPARANAPAPDARSLAGLLPRRVQLAPAAALRDTPCLVGDRIELRRALAHPDLERPVAFLGGSELAPLLDDLQASASLQDAVCGWERRLPRGRARDIARWLHTRGLIEAAS